MKIYLKVDDEGYVQSISESKIVYPGYIISDKLRDEIIKYHSVRVKVMDDVVTIIEKKEF